MKFLPVILLSAAFLLVSISVTNAQSNVSGIKSPCYDGVSSACPKGTDRIAKSPLDDASCTAQFGQFPFLITKTEELVKDHLRASMQFLMIANHFGEWQINRKGFYDYFHKLSDLTWQDAIILIEHLVKRGGKLSNEFGIPADEKDHKLDEYKLSEIHALSMALDIQKNLAKTTLSLITRATHGPSPDEAVVNKWKKDGSQRDGEFAHFLADQVSDRQLDRIKDLANHVNTLSKALDGTDEAAGKLVLYIYDTQVLN